MSETPQAAAAPPARRWRPLERNERRVAGVLAEKAKTTPDNYPLSLNAVVTGCNQKSNRFPQMTLDEGQVQEALDSLRQSGAVALIQGDSRVEKYRHLLYEWLGVDKAELAVMAELLLRGAQTVGELRGRAARMEPIKDIGELTPIVDRLRQKGLLVYLTSPGRGGVVTHNLYQPQELAKLKADHAGGDLAEGAVSHRASASAAAASPASRSGGFDDVRPTPDRPGSEAATKPPAAGDIEQLQIEVANLKRALAEIREHVDSAADALRRDLEDLKTQLGI
ncbi:MAG: DUF480 domain-containing protein [Pirellulales bacterium]|nr:DUF480 domain-containing protein [Pirellulales bacterium]